MIKKAFRLLKLSDISPEDRNYSITNHIDRPELNGDSMELLIENTSDSIAAIDQKFRLIITNHNFKRRFKKVNDNSIDLGDHLINKIKSLKAKTVWKRLLKRGLRGECFSYQFSERFQNNMIYYEATFNPIRSKSKKKITGVSFFIKDITEKTLREQELRKKNYDLMKLNQEIDWFVYSVSHDLRGPIYSIFGLINLVKLEKDRERNMVIISKMEESLKRLDVVIEDILDYSMNSRTQLRLEKINFRNMLNDIFEGLSYDKGFSQVKKIIKIENNSFYIGDYFRIKLILKNLISNAIKFRSSEDPIVKVIIKRSYTGVMVKVIDNGVGILKMHQKRVFDMFYRANHRGISGSGLGLYIVNESVKKLNGSIFMNSEVQKGTEIILELPQK